MSRLVRCRFAVLAALFGAAAAVAAPVAAEEKRPVSRSSGSAKPVAGKAPVVKPVVVKPAWAVDTVPAPLAPRALRRTQVAAGKPAILTPRPLPEAGKPAASAPVAFPECHLADAGSADAAYRLARRYLFGIGTERNQHVGVAWLRMAAQRGEPSAAKLVRFVPSDVGRYQPSCRPGGGRRATLAAPAEVTALVGRLAPGYGLDPRLVLAVIQAESGFRRDVVSPKNAAGLMQLIPETAARFKVSDVFDPEDNVRGGMAYLRWLLSYFRGDVTLALAGYNAGEGAVDRYAGIPPYSETQNYVETIRRLYDSDRHPFDPQMTAPSPILTRAEAEAGRRGPG